MADPTGYSDPDDDAHVRSDLGSAPGMPRWVKVSGAIVGALVLVFVILRLTGIGGEHGPGMHGSGAESPVGDHQGVTTRIDGAPERAIPADELAVDPDRIELTAGRPVDVALNAADICTTRRGRDQRPSGRRPRRDVIGGLMLDRRGNCVGCCWGGIAKQGWVSSSVVMASHSGHGPPGDR
jgi:hypothetical protein